MSWLGVLLSVTVLATPPALNHLKHLTAALPAGSTARIAAAGNNMPCFESPAALTAFTQAYRNGDQSGVAMYVASNSFFLEAGTRVRSLGTQGLLGQITRLKILDGDHASATCYVNSALHIYRDMKRSAARTKK